jgi:hypothetical protein
MKTDVLIGKFGLYGFDFYSYLRNFEETEYDQPEAHIENALLLEEISRMEKISMMVV